jgi:4-hydroxybenzoate polyprenyltransferase
LLQAAALAALAAVAVAGGLHPVYWVGWAAIAVLLAREHGLARGDGAARAGGAFLNVNGAVSVLYLATVLVSVALA